jgi:hypothetical protein
MLVVVALAASAFPAAGQGGREELDAMRKELELLRRTDAAIFREVLEIKALLRELLPPGRRAQGPPIPAEPLTLAGIPVKGSERARVVLIDFTDYQ